MSLSIQFTPDEEALLIAEMRFDRHAECDGWGESEPFEDHAEPAIDSVSQHIEILC